MIFQRLTIQNFLSIRSVTLDLNNRGMVLIKGKNLDNDSIDNNGSGKSSIIEALVYVLYARTVRGLKGDSVVNNISKKNTKVYLDLVDDNGDEYRIARYRKHSTNKNKSILYRNGVDITPKSEADFNEAIVNLLQMDYLTFTSSLLYTSESFKFTSASDSEMKTTFDKMLGLDVFSKCLEVTKTRLKDLESKVSNIEWKIDDKVNKMESLNGQVVETEELSKTFIKSQKEKIQELVKQRVEQEENLQIYQEDLERLEEKLKDLHEFKGETEADLKERLESIKDLEKLQSTLDEIKSDISEIKLDIKECDLKIKSYKESIGRYTKEISKKEAEIEKLKQKKLKLDDDIGQPCPVCGQPITAESLQSAKDEYDSKIEECLQEVKGFNDEIEALQSSILEQKLLIKKYNSDLEYSEVEKDRFANVLNEAQCIIDEKDECQEKLNGIKDVIHDNELEMSSVKSKIKGFEQEIGFLDKTIKTEKSNKNPYLDMLEKQKLSIAECNAEIEKLKKSIETQLDEKQCLLFWQQAYSNQGIKSFILDDITPFLNRRVNKYLSKLASGHIEVKFNTQTTLKSGETREKFSIEINNVDGGSEYMANSTGEKKRVDLAINLALQDLVSARSTKSLNIAIFDEVFDGLDESGIEAVTSLFEELSNEKSSIFVISHNPHLQSIFSNVVTIVKQNGYSNLDEGLPH